MFEIIHNDNNARLGRLTTKSGTYDTPFFMPVATKANAKFISPWQLEEIGVQSVISNSMILYLKPGLEVLEKHGGIHNFSKWKRNQFTDSGGFQVLSMQNVFEKLDDNGIYFKSPFDGSKHLLSPKKSVDNQLIIDSDVAMVLDHMPLYSYTKEEIILATNRTHKWAKIQREYHKEQNKTGQLQFGIAQGGFDVNLRIESAKYISSLNFDGIALGGLRIGEPRELTNELIEKSIKYIDDTKPRYLMGVGHPIDILEGVSYGVDIFDSVYPTRTARHGKVLTFNGSYNIKNSENKLDLRPLEDGCNCKICKQLTRSFLYHLYKSQEETVYMYLSYHNIYFMINFMKKIRQSIKENKFEEFKNKIIKLYSN